MSIRIPSLGAALALVVALPAAAQSADGVGAMYRCPGNDYNNTITASRGRKAPLQEGRERLGDGHPVGRARRIGRIAPCRRRGRSPPSPSRCRRPTPRRLRTRASNARRSLEGRLKSEEGKLSALEKEFNGGEPERHIDEFDFQKYLDRVARMRSAISRKQIEIAELRREIDKLPTPLSEPGGAARAAALDVQPGEDADDDADRAQRVDADLQPPALRQQRDRRHRDRDLQRRRRLRPAVMLVDLLVAALAPVVGLVLELLGVLLDRFLLLLVALDLVAVERPCATRARARPRARRGSACCSWPGSSSTGSTPRSS